jgi:YD repeat-containing protein
MTTATPTVNDRVRDFVAAVGEHFADLPGAERDELLTDLEQHLTELAAEAPDVLETEIADPAAYAAELRAGAGLSDRTKEPGPIARLTTATRDRVRRVLDHPRLTPLHELLPTLRPAWWIVRGWAPVVILAMMLQGGTEHWSRHIIIPGRNLAGLVAVVAAVGFSVRAGMAGVDEGRAWRVVNRVAAVAALGVVWVALTATPGQTIYVETYGFESPSGQLLTHPDGEGITNLYVYDAEGRLLRDVFVFDGSGRSVEIGSDTDDWYGIRSELRLDADGSVIGNHYPIVQYVYDANGALVLRDPPQVVVPRLPNGTESPSTTMPAEPAEPLPRETRPEAPAQ